MDAYIQISVIRALRGLHFRAMTGLLQETQNPISSWGIIRRTMRFRGLSISQRAFLGLLAWLSLVPSNAQEKPASSLPEDPLESPEISRIIRKHFPEGTPGGAALLVVKESQVLHRMGYGLENGRTPITPDTPMPLASLTKQFAGMCAAILIQEGRLSLTDKVSDHLPNVKLPVIGRDLLIQDLLWHISGLPNFLGTEERASIREYTQRHGLKRLTNETHSEWLATLPPRRAPGIQYEYTNSGYVLLARIIEVIVGKPFHEVQREMILEPLGMHQTQDSTTFNGSGNMRMSLNDYGKWDRALWDGKLLTPETWRLVCQSGTLDNGESIGYSFGWRLVHDGDQVVEMSHDGVGSPPGNCRNRVVRDLRNRITVVLLIRENTNFHRTLRKQIVEEIHDWVRHQP